MGTSVDDGRAHDARDDGRNDEEAVGLAKTAGEVAREHDGAARQERVRDVDEGALEVGEAKGLDDEVGKVCGAAVGDLGEDLEADDAPCFGIDETFAHLGPFPGCFFGAPRSGDDDAVGGVLFFLRVKEVCAGDGVGEGEPQHKRPEKGHDAEDDVHPPPGSHGIINVSYAKGEKGCDEPADGVAAEPDPRAHGDLVARVKRGGHEHEGRGDGGFDDTEEKPHSEEAAVVGACCGEADDGAPDEGVAGQVAGDGQAGDELVGDGGPEEVAKVEYGGYPRILLPDEILIQREEVGE